MARSSTKALTTSGFANVLTSPISPMVTLAFKTRLTIFPERVFGKASVNMIISGLTVGPATLRTYLTISPFYSSVFSTTCIRVIYAKIVEST
ncbi:hypothetical protein DSAG12_02667 [Promethearchaeum syntrophicum]|uniref:Uncharacterized protein n=1 Tax=Promethearchaeum syntrophicum TaxID=2594042 RepID=A0A5B9DD85_9ARCH|nr:hypothetical protein [Candidatus Prometheoarchaeum syntrophicum]QEE16837.1 hypothetical protein DSAG12_02667 [Candidatus Prometheoarchaeum syntrophicum]